MIEVSDFPAFILVDDKGNDFYKQVARVISMALGGFLLPFGQIQHGV